ncbi:SDR family oxidoreductase [Xenophilus arseniciresistens]|uniref:SDR family oxidoreductase n=1 Tax=Xenophilus arseniciresistens TaxID=1283306 RepID=A0AAE3SZL9_9BURK|nr:SDR family oxidoreductase [Xenophilus arseniciresistens]MDA7415372.1 SDR family oxidoreductase [Xenophilus arseniciresistens]
MTPQDAASVAPSTPAPSPGALPAPPRLAAKGIVLTGASSGIGRATALAMASEGAALVLAARDEAALQGLVRECEALGGRATAVPTDVTDPEAVAALARRALEVLGQVDVWINNVGVGAVGRFDETPVAAHRRVVEANLLGHIHGAHAILGAMRQRGRGTLINMISIGGWIPTPYAAAYSASKFGLRGFSEALRGELVDLPGVHVCEVYPTFVDSPGLSHGANYSGRQVGAPPPLIDPRRVARVLVALSASERPRAKTYMGAPALPGMFAHALAPDLLARAMGHVMRRALAGAGPALAADGNLFQSSRTHEVDGGFRRQRRPFAAPGGYVLLGLMAAGAAWALRPRRA